MSKFVNAVLNQDARTENGMLARKSTANANVDLFFNVGASRGKDILPQFVAAFTENKEYALRIAQWTRDVRGGAGERKLFRDILAYLVTHEDRAIVLDLLKKTPEIGRWDDLFTVIDSDYKTDILKMVKKALLVDENGLAAKWCPRQGPIAGRLRSYLKLSPKKYRKMLVKLTNVVETQMCGNEWDAINFNAVPSLASARYKKAFQRHTKKYAEWAEKLVKGDKTVKVNAGAVYPYDVIKNAALFENKAELDVIVAQWDALPNYVGDASILPMVDVSGSMVAPVGNNVALSVMDVAVSLGLYLADKNKGDFKDTFLTFSESPELLHLKGNILQKITQMKKSRWQMNTNLHAAFDRILTLAVTHKVPQEDMPKILLILSDMQFDQGYRYDDTALQMIQRKYTEAGYTVPAIVFWNLRATENVPVKFDERGTALVSGFSPTIVKAILKADLSKMTPEATMLDTIMDKRYALSVFSPVHAAHKRVIKKHGKTFQKLAVKGRKKARKS